MEYSTESFSENSLHLSKGEKMICQKEGSTAVLMPDITVRLGCVNIFFGYGAGKTSAVMGRALRGVGAGVSVDVIQFMKSGDSSEVRVLDLLPGVTYFCAGNHEFVYSHYNGAQHQHAMRSFEFAQDRVRMGARVVVLDEILNVPLASRDPPFFYDDIQRLIDQRHPNCELYLTGRECPLEMQRVADGCTRLEEVRHPYQNGVLARKGVDY